MTIKASPRWKEEMVVWDEAGNTFVFDGAWGVDPHHAYVPFEADWTRCVPAWLAHRRTEVVEAIAATGHLVKEGRYPFLESTSK